MEFSLLETVTLDISAPPLSSFPSKSLNCRIIKISVIDGPKIFTAVFSPHNSGKLWHKKLLEMDLLNVAAKRKKER
jgi:hypothetical protein